jgi:molybdate transport system substrate-binding protein
MKIIRLSLLIILLPALVQATELSVFAASSLTEVLREVAHLYEARHPADKVLLHFAGSQALATQIEQGAPADLFIAANSAAMERLQKKGLAENPQPLLHNRLMLAAQPELREQLSSIRDLADQELLLAVGNRQVPIGRYTRRLFANLTRDPEYGPELINNIERNIVSEENMVKAIVAKLLLGEIDAGIVYQSDLFAEAAKNLLAIKLPEEHNPLATYPVAQTSDRNADCADLLSFLFSSEAQQLFARHGFLTGVEQ